MRICVAQIRPVAGDIATNKQKHLTLIELAISKGAQMICFPELSLAGYEPKLAEQLVFEQGDRRLDTFQEVADSSSITVALGLPTATNGKPNIGMMIFQPDQAQTVYAKQLLHDDELPYFSPGVQQITLTTDPHVIAPAICYESLQASHAACVAELNADIYLASVAKPSRGVEKAYDHYPNIARRYGMMVVMANSVGSSDDFISAGQSAVWDTDGERLVQLDGEREGIVVLDTLIFQASQHYL